MNEPPPPRSFADRRQGDRRQGDRRGMEADFKRVISLGSELGQDYLEFGGNCNLAEVLYLRGEQTVEDLGKGKNGGEADPRIVDGLSPFHIWTPDYAFKRLRWKPRHPLHVLLLPFIGKTLLLKTIKSS